MSPSTSTVMFMSSSLSMNTGLPACAPELRNLMLDSFCKPNEGSL